MQLPAKQKTVEVKGNTYSVTFPTNRGLMNIYARKAQLSREMHDTLKFGLDSNARYVALLIDALATLEVIMPEQFTKDLNISSIVDGDILVGAELVKIYQDQLEEWFGEWVAEIGKILNTPKKEEAKKHHA